MVKYPTAILVVVDLQYCPVCFDSISFCPTSA